MERVALACGLAVDSRHRVLCPFHDDSRPSMQLYPHNYHCFVCGAHGDAIDMVEAIQGLDKKEAAEKVAEICGNKAYFFDEEAAKRDAARKRKEDEYDKALDELYEAEAQIARLNARICDLSPFTLAWAYSYGQLNEWLMRYSAADNKVLEMRFAQYEQKHKHR